MALRLSTALRNALNTGGSMLNLMANCVLKVYTGAQPSTADAAPTGTLLCTYSKSGGALTREVLAVGSVALTGGGSGSVNTLTVNGLEIMGSATAFDGTLIQTATDIVAKINANPQNLLFTASNANGTSATITITAKPGLGALPNGWTVASTVTTITKTDTNMASGVNAVNGLSWLWPSAAGVLSKDANVWQGTAVATGTAGWCRFEAAVNDPGTLDTTPFVISRIDGAVATSGAELNMGSTAVVSGAIQSVASFTITLPTA
jgi:hypothetical protein